MATCQETVTAALRLARVIGVSASPTSSESDRGLECLQSLYDGWVTGGMFGELEDVYLDSSDTAEEGKRYFVPTGYTLTDTTSIYVDAEGNTRQPRDLSLYESLTEAGTRTVKLYDRTAWVSMTGLTLASTAPLSNRGMMGLAAVLATSGAFAAMFGANALIDPDIRQLAAQFRGNIIGKSGSTQDTEGGVDYY